MQKLKMWPRKSKDVNCAGYRSKITL
jgi:hypothetical protein